MDVRRGNLLAVGVALGLLAVFPAGPAAAADVAIAPSRGATVYVPVYSHIYYGNRAQRLDLTATLSIRNTDPKRAIRVVSANYHDSSGKLVRNFLDKPVDLPPLAATRLLVKESDRSGGSGASFLVRWRAEQDASPPIIEAVMVGTAGNRGMTFASRGREIAVPVDAAAPAN